MKYKLSTSLIAVSLCFSGVSAFAQESGPQLSGAVLKGAGTLDTQLRVLSSCARSYQATLEKSVEAGLGFKLSPGSPIYAGCSSVIASVSASGNVLTLTTGSASPLSTPLRSTTFLFSAYADSGSTAFSNQDTIGSWDCRVNKPLQPTSNLFSVPIMGVLTNVLATSGVTLSYCQPAVVPGT